jgi:hypothetical protein
MNKPMPSIQDLVNVKLINELIADHQAKLSNLNPDSKEAQCFKKSIHLLNSLCEKALDAGMYLLAVDKINRNG